MLFGVLGSEMWNNYIVWLGCGMVSSLCIPVFCNVEIMIEFFGTMKGQKRKVLKVDYGSYTVHGH